MAEIRYFPGAAAQRVRQEKARKPAPEESPAGSASQYCAYSLTNARLIALGIEKVDGSTGAAEARLLALEPGGELALWISPFKKISSACARFPIDLVFLDRNFAVLDTAEFFPMNLGGAMSAQAESILVLAADSVAQGAIQAGDQLMIALPEELQQYLRNQPNRGALLALEMALKNAAGADSKPPADRSAEEMLPSATDAVRIDQAKAGGAAESGALADEEPVVASDDHQETIAASIAPLPEEDGPVSGAGVGRATGPVEIAPGPVGAARDLSAQAEPQTPSSPRAVFDAAQIPLEFPGWSEPAAAESRADEAMQPEINAERPATEQPAVAKEDLSAGAAAFAPSQATEIAPAGAESNALEVVSPAIAASSILERPSDKAGDTSEVASPKDAADQIGRRQPPAATNDRSEKRAPSTLPDAAARDLPAPAKSEVGSQASAKIASNPAVPTPAEVAAGSQQQPWMKHEPRRTWIERIVAGEVQDPRKSRRESLAGLVAYYFTGGPPKPHAVRDISTSGLYLVTHERWYRGTVVQMTLTDHQNSTFDRSISLYAKAVRLGSDGVGFRFVLDGERQRPGKVLEVYAPTNGISSAKVAMFIRRFKATLQAAE